MKRLLFLVVVLLLLVPLTLYAQTPTYDAVTNGTFDTDDSSWTATAGTTQSHSSAEGNPPGSISLSGNVDTLESTNPCYVIPGDWPDVAGRRYYAVRYDALNPESNPGDATARVEVYAYSDTSCTTEVFRQESTLHEGSGWQSYPTDPFDGRGHDIDFYGNVAAFRVVLRAVTVGGGQDFEVLYDNVRVYSSTPNAITLSSMQATSGMGRVDTTIAVVLAGSAGLLALAGLFRRRLMHQGD